MKLKNKEFSGFAALAPMAGVADRAMREICRSFGAAYTVGELTSAKGVSLGDKKSEAYLSCFPAEKPMASQLFGYEPSVMAEAAKKAREQNPDFIDINMGCPAPKVAGNGGGSALMKDPVLAGKIVEAVVKAVDIPVTVKMRTGWDENSINAPLLAKICEESGAAAITVHGRTRRQMYAPGIDFNTIAEVKKTVKIPVIANGDINSGITAQEMLEKTGADFLMVGRAAMGNPFIFREINAFLLDGTILPEPTIKERLDTMLAHIKLMCEYKNERTAIMESRKHTAWYLKGMRGAAKLRILCGQIESLDDIYAIYEKALANSENM